MLSVDDGGGERSKVSTIAKWAVGVLLSILAISTICFWIIFRQLTIDHVSTVVSLEFPFKSDYPDFFSKIEELALKNGLRRVGKNHGSSSEASWRNESSAGISLYLQNKTEGLSILITIAIESNPENNHSWRSLLSDIKEIVESTGEKVNVRLQLDPALYGACTSPSRPTIKDTTCSIELPDNTAIEKLDEILKSARSKHDDYLLKR